jgi:hypothetical protein
VTAHRFDAIAHVVQTTFDAAGIPDRPHQRRRCVHTPNRSSCCPIRVFGQLATTAAITGPDRSRRRSRIIDITFALFDLDVCD